MEICVLIVTYNRLNDLKRTLSMYEDQSYLPKNILVVNNCSTDSTEEFLTEWVKKDNQIEKYVINTSSNIGGSGGFAKGISEALKLNWDYLYISDDDALPRKDTLKHLYDYRTNSTNNCDDVIVLCSAVYNKDHFSGIHRCKFKKGILGYVETPIKEDDYLKEVIDIDIYSFVGTLIRRDVLEIEKGPNKEFFIYNDDYEHAMRVGRYGRMVCIPASVIEHTDNSTPWMKASWRDYYATRNAVYTHKMHFGVWAAVMRALRRMGMGILSRQPKKVHIIIDGIIAGFREETGLNKKYQP